MIIPDKRIPIIRTNTTVLDKDVVQKLVMEHQQYQGRYNKLWDYYVGKHEILNKTYEDPSKPCNQVVLELPSYVVNILTGMMSGEPISITSTDDKQLEEMQKIMDNNDFHGVFCDLDEISSIYGQSYLILYINADGEIVMKPQAPTTTFVVYDDTLDENEVFGINYYRFQDGVTNDIVFHINAYTASEHIVFEGDLFHLEEVSREPHYFGKVPVVEFYNNNARRGAFEKVIKVVDALERILSDNIDSIDYFADCYLLLKNLDATEESDILEMKKNRVMLVSDDGDAKFICPEMEDTFNNNTIKTLEEHLFMIATVPRLSDSSFSSNSSGTALSYKLFGATKTINVKTNIFKKSFRKVFALVNQILTIRGFSFDVNNLKQVYVVSLPSDIVSLADSISKLRGTVSQETLLSQLNFVVSPKIELEKYRAEVEYNAKQQMEMMDMYSDFSMKTNSDDADPTKATKQDVSNQDKNNFARKADK